MQRSTKKRDKLIQGQIERLDDFGFVRDPFREQCEKAFEEFQNYKAELGNLVAPQSYRTGNGFNLWAWVNKQRTAKKQDKLTQGRIERLDDLGFLWDSG